MNKTTNYEYCENDKTNKGVILTHGLTSSIKGKSLKIIESSFYKNGFSTFSFDMYAHGLSKGNLEDFTLSKVYKQIQEGYDFLEKKGCNEIFIYAVSASALPALKFSLDKKIKKVFLRVPAINMFLKRYRELGYENMQKWEKKGIISVGTNYKTGGDLLFKYDFIKDLLNNFHNLNLTGETEIFIGGGLKDSEAPIDELRQLSIIYKNITLWEFDETHNFSDNGIQDYIKKLQKLNL